jgi:hypothetical protein
MHRNGMAGFWAEQSARQFDGQLAQLAAETFGITSRIVPVPWATGYAVTECGIVLTCRVLSREPQNIVRVLRPFSQRKTGRLVVRLVVGNKPKAVGVHRLVAEAFLPPPSRGQNVVRHLDGNPMNNKSGNLAWGTQASCAHRSRPAHHSGRLHIIRAGRAAGAPGVRPIVRPAGGLLLRPSPTGTSWSPLGRRRA